MDHVQHGIFRLGRAAQGAAIGHGFIARQGHQPELERGLHQLRRLFQGAEGIQGVEQQGQHVAAAAVGHRLRQLGEVGRQAQGRQVLPQAVEQLDGVRRVQHGPPALFIEGHLRIGQQLAGCGHAAALAPGPPGNHGEPAPVRGQHGEDFVRVPGHRFPQHQAARYESFRLHSAASLYSKYASGAPVAQNRAQRSSMAFHLRP